MLKALGLVGSSYSTRFSYDRDLTVIRRFAFDARRRALSLEEDVLKALVMVGSSKTLPMALSGVCPSLTSSVFDLSSLSKNRHH